MVPSLFTENPNIILPNRRSPANSEEPKRRDWDVLFPSISLRDWSVQMMSVPSLRAADSSKESLMAEAWLFAPERAEER